MNEKLSQARIELIMRHPFFGNLLMNRPIEETTEVDTMAVRGDGTIMLNRGFVENCSVDELVFALAHETMHWMFGHVERINERDEETWNVACDCVVNALLVKERIGTPLENICIMKDAANMTADEVYSLLKKDDEQHKSAYPDLQKKLAGTKGKASDKDEEGEGNSQGADSKEQSAKAQMDRKMEIGQTLQATRMQGMEMDSIMERASKVIQSKVSWDVLLEKYFTDKVERHQKWTKPNKRFLNSGVYLPKRERLPHMGRVVCAIDTSGSMSEDDVAIILGNVSRLCEMCNPSQLDILYTTDRVYKTETYYRNDYPIPMPKRLKSGGTDMRKAIWWAERADEEVDLLVIFTDGYTHTTSYDGELVWVIVGDERRKHFQPISGEVLFV